MTTWANGLLISGKTVSSAGSGLSSNQASQESGANTTQSSSKMSIGATSVSAAAPLNTATRVFGPNGDILHSNIIVFVTQIRLRIVAVEGLNLGSRLARQLGFSSEVQWRAESDSDGSGNSLVGSPHPLINRPNSGSFSFKVKTFCSFA